MLSASKASTTPLQVSSIVPESSLMATRKYHLRIHIADKLLDLVSF